MMKQRLTISGYALLLIGAFSLASAQTPTPAPPTQKTVGKQDPKARALLAAAHAKLRSIKALIADIETNSDKPTKHFDPDGRVYLERPNRFRIESLAGAALDEGMLLAVSDGVTTTRFDGGFIAYEKPIHKENFFLGHDFLVQFFFDPQGIRFDPGDPFWGRPVSLFDINVSAYDKSTQITLLGERIVEYQPYRVVEIKYNTRRYDLRQHIYIGADDLVYQVDTYFDGAVTSQKFRNFRISAALPAKTWRKDNPAEMPFQAIDPVRLGAPAPDFVLPGYNGGEFTLKQLLAGKKGAYVCALDGSLARITGNADTHLAQMRILQEMKDKYEKQGLAVIAIVGGPTITPDLKEEMMLNWMPDVKRFNYPILLDFDLERGLQGTAYQNFQLNGRNNILLDAKGRVVFAAQNFDDKVNQLALYQALAQIGFAVSAADLEGAAAEAR